MLAQALSSLLNPQLCKSAHVEDVVASSDRGQPTQLDSKAFQRVVLRPEVTDVLLTAVRTASEDSHPGMLSLFTPTEEIAAFLQIFQRPRSVHV